MSDNKNEATVALLKSTNSKRKTLYLKRKHNKMTFFLKNLQYEPKKKMEQKLQI